MYVNEQTPLSFLGLDATASASQRSQQPLPWRLEEDEENKKGRLTAAIIAGAVPLVLFDQKETEHFLVHYFHY